MGTPMTCWVSTEFKGDMGKYALDYCYIQNTYVLPNEENDASFDRSKVFFIFILALNETLVHPRELLPVARPLFRPSSYGLLFPLLPLEKVVQEQR